MTAWKGVVLAVGIFVLAVDMWDILLSLVVPRPWRYGPVVGTLGTTRRIVRRGIAHLKSFSTRDRFLAALEGLLMLVRLGLWLGIALVGYAIVMWATSTIALTAAFVRSGSDIFTLGFADPRGAGSSFVAFLAAATGLIIVALQIAYLPALYDAFNRRETLVSLLESRASSPAWGPELLARHHLIGLESELERLYADWERWAADVAESHTTYPALMYLRSPHPTNSWIVSLVAVMDAAALQLSLQPSTAPSSARMCVRMGSSSLRDIAIVQRLVFNPDPMPNDEIELTYNDFLEGVTRISKSGIEIERTAEEAWPHFRGWRVNYESIAFQLAKIVVAPPAPWLSLGVGAEAPILPKRPIDRRPDLKGGLDLDRG
jgi:hypothetical protein